MADVIVPQLGEQITEATISIWLKSIDDLVEADEPIVEVSTDKVDTEIVAPTSGRLTEIRVLEGESAAVGDVIAVLSVDGTAGSTPTATRATTTKPPVAPTPSPEDMAAPPNADLNVTIDSTTIAQAPPGALATRRLLSPEVRRLLAKRLIDPSTITGSGAGGRVTPADVRAAAPTSPAASPPEKPEPSATGGGRTRVSLSRIRLATGRHMINSLATTPHALSAVEINYSNVDHTRKSHRDHWKSREGFSLTYLPFITRAIVDALRAFPHLNASIDGDELVVHPSIHMGIAVDLDHEGRMVPVIRNADSKRLRALSREVNDLATRARARKLTADALSGGTFTITNNGSAGSVLSSAIINQPQVAIVSTDAVVRRPTVVKLDYGDEAIAIHPIGILTMTWDHRAFDGAYAAGFLVEVKSILESRDWGSELRTATI